MKKSPKWKTLHSKTVHQNPWYRVLHDKVIRPDGKKGDYFVVETKGPAVFIVAVNPKKEVALIHLQRYPTRTASWEIPAGSTDGQPLLNAAKRELKEETGFIAKKWKKIAAWQSMNGVCGEYSHIYLATRLSKTKTVPDKTEGISEVKFIPYKKVLKMILEGKITDGQSIVSLFITASRLGWIRF